MTKRRTQKRKAEDKPIVSPKVIIGVVVAALLVVGGLILLGTNQNNNTAAQPANLADFPSKGDDNAPVTMVEYSDFGCPHCQSFVLEKADQIIENYVDTGKVKYVIHPFHLGNENIAFATEAAWCADEQDKFFEYQKALFENQGMTINQATLADLAEQTGLDRAPFTECVSNRTYQDELENARRAAINRGINSTPTFYINGEKVSGNQPYETFQHTIERKLAAAQ